MPEILHAHVHLGGTALFLAGIGSAKFAGVVSNAALALLGGSGGVFVNLDMKQRGTNIHQKGQPLRQAPLLRITLLDGVSTSVFGAASATVTP